MCKKLLIVLAVVVVTMFSCHTAIGQPDHHTANVNVDVSRESNVNTDASSSTSVKTDADEPYQGVPWIPIEFPSAPIEEPFFWNKALDSGSPKVRWAQQEIKAALDPSRLIELGPISLGPLQWGRGFKSDLITWAKRKPTKVVHVYSSDNIPDLQSYVKIGSVGVVAKKECLEERVRVEANRLAMKAGAELVIYQSDLNTQVEAEAGGLSVLPLFGTSSPGSVTGALGIQGGKTKKTGCPGVTADLYIKM